MRSRWGIRGRRVSQGEGREPGLVAFSVAAVIPLYNGASFIREALESVLAQTVPVDEIIVVDDGSTDEGPAIVAELAESHPITLLGKPNGGQSSARNLAIRHTRCSHVAFLDQDDAWHENHVELLRRPFLDGQTPRLGLVYGNLDQIDREGRAVLDCCLDDVSSPQPKRSRAECLRHDMFILPGAALVSRQAILDAGLFDERLSGYEDDDLFVRLFSLGFRSIYIKTAVTRWRIYSGSTSFSDRMARSRMIYFRKLLDAFPDEPRLGFYWGRDVIGPRFLEVLRNEFVQGSRIRDVARMRQAWEDLQEVVRVMKPRPRRRVALVRPIVSALYAGPFTGVARLLVRRATR